MFNYSFTEKVLDPQLLPPPSSLLPHSSLLSLSLSLSLFLNHSVLLSSHLYFIFPPKFPISFLFLSPLFLLPSSSPSGWSGSGSVLVRPSFIRVRPSQHVEMICTASGPGASEPQFLFAADGRSVEQDSRFLVERPSKNVARLSVPAGLSANDGVVRVM
ncbi:unnamed protein product [Protopolystoma xenopodis]|uniref:Uncharacterized protein n=1 Tax=Protopolystoma xenopodis TaxID=117903 RepID=A0A3S4ZUB1_9PLAT|nr:unnamed protein product [Protopolystoma xenopodis]